MSQKEINIPLNCNKLQIKRVKYYSKRNTTGKFKKRYLQHRRFTILFTVWSELLSVSMNRFLPHSGLKVLGFKPLYVNNVVPNSYNKKERKERNNIKEACYRLSAIIFQRDTASGLSR